MSTTTAIVKATKPARLCRCDCGLQVVRAKSLYRPGHDAKHVSLVIAGVATLDTLPSKALRVKANDAIARKEAKPSKSVKATAKSVQPVKVGRWTYPARRTSGGTIERNTKRDGSGEWVAA